MSEDRAAEGLEHLQAAALEMIAAARAFLDVAEELVSDPDRVAGTLASLATLVDVATRSRRPGAAAPAGGPASPAEEPFTATEAAGPLAGATFGDGTPLGPRPARPTAADEGRQEASGGSRIRRIDVS
jgi:hypothetical protein